MQVRHHMVLYSRWLLSWLVQFMWLLPGRCGQVVSPAAVYRQEIPTRARPHYWWVSVLFYKFKFAMFTVRCKPFSLLYGPSPPLSPSLSLPSSLLPPLSLSSFFSSSPSPSLLLFFALSLPLPLSSFSQGWSLEHGWSTLMGNRLSYKFGIR